MAGLKLFARRARPPVNAFPQPERFAEAVDTLRRAAAAGQLPNGVLAEIADRAWTIGRVLARDRPTGPTATEAQLLRGFARAILASLEQVEIRVPDITGQRFFDNMDVEVAEWRVDPALRHKTIVETESPLILRGEDRLRRPRVVVGEPPRDAPPLPPDDGDHHAL